MSIIYLFILKGCYNAFRELFSNFSSGAIALSVLLIVTEVSFFFLAILFFVIDFLAIINNVCAWWGGYEDNFEKSRAIFFYKTFKRIIYVAYLSFMSNHVTFISTRNKVVLCVIKSLISKFKHERTNITLQ